MILSVIGLLNPIFVQALSESQIKVFQSGVGYFNVAPDDQAGSSGCSTASLPAISDPAGVATAIDQFIISHGGQGSPFEGLGASIVAGATRAGVSPFLVVAIALKESSFGTAGIATQGTYNAFGRTAVSGQPSVDVGNSHIWYRWDSWLLSVDGPNDESSFLKSVYVDGFGLTDIKAVVFRYAPPGENNSDLYAKQINDWINELVASSGTALSCGSVSGVPGNPSANALIGQRLAAERGWVGPEWECLYQLWQKESNWNEKADNPNSSAYGIPQALPGSKMASAGADWETNPETQIKWGLGYIAGRADYGTPCAAWTLWQSRSPHWY